MRKTFLRIIRLLLVVFLVGDGEMVSQSTSPVSTFTGNWKFTFAGALSGDGTMVVSPDGSLTISLTLGKYQHLFTNPISLKVSNTGALNGNIFLWRLTVGSVIGIISSAGDLYGEVATPVLDVGTVTGKLTQSSGKGTYQSVAGNGTWTAQKN